MSGTVISVPKLEMHSQAFRNILHSDNVNALIRDTGRTLISSAKVSGMKNHVQPSTRFRDARLIGFVGKTWKGTPESIEKEKRQMANAVTRHVHRSFIPK